MATKRHITTYDRDPSNYDYYAKTSDVYDVSGAVLPFQLQKYAPIIDYIIQYFNITTSINNMKLLDIGIGYGTFLKVCEEKEIEDLYGMDPHPVSINIARKYTTADLRVGKVEELPWPFAENYFDVITCLDVVEHLPDPAVLFENAKKYISDNGIIVVRTPNGELPYLMRELPFIGIKDTNPTHINIHNPTYWRKLAQKNDLDMVIDWKGEHLTHTKFIPYIIRKICNLRKVDHRKVPLLNMFEQAYIMVLSRKKIDTTE